MTPENFEEMYTEYVVDGGYPDSYLMSGIMTEEEIQQFLCRNPGQQLIFWRFSGIPEDSTLARLPSFKIDSPKLAMMNMAKWYQ